MWKTYSVPCHILIRPASKIVDYAPCPSPTPTTISEIPSRSKNGPSPGLSPKPPSTTASPARRPRRRRHQAHRQRPDALYTIAVRTETMLIDKPDDLVSKPIKLGRGTITLTELKAGDKEISFALSRSHSSEDAAQAVINGTSPSAAELLVGGRLPRRRWRQGTHGNELLRRQQHQLRNRSRRKTPPQKSNSASATKTKTLTIPIELPRYPPQINLCNPRGVHASACLLRTESPDCPIPSTMNFQAHPRTIARRPRRARADLDSRVISQVHFYRASPTRHTMSRPSHK